MVQAGSGIGDEGGGGVASGNERLAFGERKSERGLAISHRVFIAAECCDGKITIEVDTG